jgi:zinc/manganese transport system substrate-binding protein
MQFLKPTVTAKLLAIRFVCLFLAVGCPVRSSAEAPEKPTGADRLNVVTTNPILEDMVRHVGGDRVDVSCLLPPGMDLHAFDPTPATVRRLAEADLLVINGYGLEAALDPILENADYGGPIVTAASASNLIKIEAHGTHLHDEDHDHGPVDPHAWHDLRNAVTYVEVIRDALVELNPKAAGTYSRLAELYIREIRTLDTWTRRLLLPLPVSARSMLISHQGLAYLGEAYGLEIVTVVGLSPYQDPDARQIGLIIDELKARKVAAIFVEVGANPGLIHQISRESGIPISDALYTGTLGVDEELSATFTGMFRLNIMRIVRALSPDAQANATTPPS